MNLKNTEKKTPSGENGINLSSISAVLDVILGVFSIPSQPVLPLPPPLILIGSKLRPGLSADAIKARIISRQSEAGLPVGDVFADGQNTNEAMISIAIDEIVNAILTEAVVNVVIAPGTQVSVIGVGNLGAPVISQGATTSNAVGDGIIR